MRLWNWNKYRFLLIVFALMCPFVQADITPSAQAEITLLLDFVEHSPCSFLRNGKQYPASEARAHLQSKLDYLLKKNMVKSAEDFIEFAGSKSSLSGRPYEVNCANRTQTSEAWLQAELERIRSEHQVRPGNP
ncbi:DUF5329 domain-containing protein [Pseudomonas delhiensis]|uniref:DUF5329 domain-containing protein n=1 Tax=Pseudomonas delhiensis TaxID=366289 RepID=UPI0014289E2F|nr:DUF5329 domain-containing protein [Pseudomonas delhiensis]